MVITDLQITDQIVGSLERLKINQIVSALHNIPTENTEIEFYPILTEAKDSLERLLRMAVLLGGWMREENIKIRNEANKKVAHLILKKLNSIEVWKESVISWNEEGDFESILILISYLAKIQFYFTKWLVYLHKSYNADIKKMINFIFKDKID